MYAITYGEYLLFTCAVGMCVGISTRSASILSSSLFHREKVFLLKVSAKWIVIFRFVRGNLLTQ
jgi:hypothetical protein